MKPAIDNLEAHSSILNGKKIGLITNQTGVTSSFEPTINLLHKNFNLIKLFAPEHGVRGDLQAGIMLEGYTDNATSLPVISLYGANRRPSAENLADVDILAFDIQDVGSRFYTYLYTMAYAMQSCAENNKKFVIFDRPNPLNADTVEGNILNTEYKSFIGLYPIPQRYGLTIGECAKMFNEEFDINCDLEVIPITNYDRKKHMTNEHWVLPSPNIPTIETCFTFNATCIFEGTNVSEGRGTATPFNTIGAPWINAQELADILNNENLPGVHFRAHHFTPIKYHPTLSKYPGELCNGVYLHLLDCAAFQPIKTGLTVLYKIREKYEGHFAFNPPFTNDGRPMIDYNTGDKYIREGKLSLNKVLEIYEQDAMAFKKIKQKYHIYK